jgi:hypothetical protein
MPTIDEGIKELNSLHECLKPDTDQAFLHAIKLGIESLKRVRAQRKYPNWKSTLPLRGETKVADANTSRD